MEQFLEQFLELYQECLAEFGDASTALEVANAAAGTNYTADAVQKMLNPTTSNTKAGMFAKFSGLLRKIRNKFGEGKSLISENLPELKGLGKDIRATQLWDGGPKISTAANTLSGIYQGGKAIKGLYDNSTKDSDYNDLKQDITLQIASNPMYDMYMDASDEKLLRQMNNGTLTDNWSGAINEGIKGVPKAAGAAILGGLTGGIPGALIGGLGSLANSGISGYGKGTEEANAKLQGLYSRLKQADEEYRTMKRPSGLRRAGLSTQYFNQLY